MIVVRHKPGSAVRQAPRPAPAPVAKADRAAMERRLEICQFCDHRSAKPCSSPCRLRSLQRNPKAECPRLLWGRALVADTGT